VEYDQLKTGEEFPEKIEVECYLEEEEESEPLGAPLKPRPDYWDCFCQLWTLLIGCPGALCSLWWRIPQPFRFVICGGTGALLHYYFNILVFFSFSSLESEYKAALAFGVSNFISLIWKHAFHRNLVFNDRTYYWQSLLTFYASYSISIAGSPFLDALYTVWVGLNMKEAYWATICSFGIFNFAILKFTIDSSDKDTDLSIEMEQLAFEDASRKKHCIKHM